jgi:hypothetical protein
MARRRASRARRRRELERPASGVDEAVPRGAVVSSLLDDVEKMLGGIVDIGVRGQELNLRFSSQGLGSELCRIGVERPLRAR